MKRTSYDLSLDVVENEFSGRSLTIYIRRRYLELIISPTNDLLKHINFFFDKRSKFRKGFDVKS